MASLSDYLNEKRHKLAHNYEANCLTIARDIASLLVVGGKRPYIACLHKEEETAAGKLHYPLMPRRYNGRVTWTKHYVCCCEGWPTSLCLKSR
jgi:hypothetical protein